MKKLFIISVMVCILTAGCGGQKDFFTATPSITPVPSLKATSIATSTATKTPRPTYTPTQTITPLPAYKTKKVIFDYNVSGDYSVWEFFFDPNYFRADSKLVLYDDGQLIIPGPKYRQRVLSQSEIKRFLSKLDALGFYSLESNQAHDPTDKLYVFGNNYEQAFDAYMYCIVINANKSRKLCVYEPGIPYLIPRMKNILKYLDGYEPAGLTTYYPDRILLWVQPGRNPDDDKLPTTAIPWPENLPPIGISKENITYIDGNTAKEIYTLFDSTNAGKVFTQNGNEFTVYINVILPHEEVSNADQ